jgi:hypothetical protein
MLDSLQQIVRVQVEVARVDRVEAARQTRLLENLQRTAESLQRRESTELVGELRAVALPEGRPVRASRPQALQLLRLEFGLQPLRLEWCVC